MKQLFKVSFLFITYTFISNCFIFDVASKSINSHKITLPEKNPKEIGLVHWRRSLEDALTESAITDKPVLLLFQEVPGCQGCRDFGTGPLNNLLIVEAIETLFIPAFIYNNKAGYDEKILKQYDEPAWNYPVIRFLNKAGKDIISKEKSRVTTTTNYLANRMIYALKTANKKIPIYLKLLADEHKVTQHQVATFQMACYWQGERVFGNLEGVVSTKSRWIRTPLLEVVDVKFLPGVINYKILMTHAMKQKCADKIYTHTKEQELLATQLHPGHVFSASKVATAKSPGWDEQKYYLKQSKALRYLPLINIQATRINSLIANKVNLNKINDVLSSQQVNLLQRINGCIKKNKALFSNFSIHKSYNNLYQYTKRLERHLDNLCSK